MLLIFVLLILLFDTVAAHFIKKTDLTTISFELLIAITLYTFICIILIKSTEYDDLQNVYLLWNIGGIILIALIKLVFVDSELEPHEIIATILVGIAGFILYYFRKTDK